MIEKRLPLILALMLVIAYFFAPQIPLTLKRIFYTLSLNIKEVLTFVLPFIIFSFLFQGLVSLRSIAIKFMIFIIPAIFLSGFVALQVAYFFGKFIFSNQAAITQFTSLGKELTPLWEFSLPKLISINLTLFAGIILGLTFPLVSTVLSQKTSNLLAKVSSFILRSFFIPIIPIFIFGFLIRMAHEGHLEMIIKDYSWILIYIVSLSFSYSTLLYLIACGFNIKRTVQSIKNIIPALVTGFSTMSSAVAMPFLIEGAQKNSPHPQTVRAVIPLSINPHLLGDAMSISLFSFAILLSFGHTFPSFETYFVVCLYLLISKFGVAGIPGGGILVLTPVLAEHLGFDSTMISLITAIYILFDPFITAGNVYGNGAFAMLFANFFEKRK